MTVEQAIEVLKTMDPKAKLYFDVPDEAFDEVTKIDEVKDVSCQNRFTIVVMTGR